MELVGKVVYIPFYMELKERLVYEVVDKVVPLFPSHCFGLHQLTDLFG